MPVLARTSDALTQVCAMCGAERGVPYDQIVQRERDGSIALELPPCACGAVELLLPCIDDGEHPRPGSDGHLHQLVVDEIAARVCARPLSSERRKSLAQWLPEGARLALTFPRRS